MIISDLLPLRHNLLSWISIQQKLALARQIVAELRQTHAHERSNEGELLGFSDNKALAES